MEMNNRYTVINCEVLNLRNQPSLASEIIDKIPEGTEVYIDEKYIHKYFYDKSQSEIASNLGYSQAKVSREEKKILVKLKNYYKV